MATRLPPVHALSAFEAAARHNSFAIAAEELCITPSALSHRIRLLEDFVGERLFHRDGRSISLSEFGRRYLEVVRSALRTLTDFPMPHRDAVLQPRIKIVLPPTFARFLFIPRLKDFLQKYPDIVLEMYLSVPLYDLSLSESDIEIRFGAGRYANLVTEKLFEEPAFAIASPAYLKTIRPLNQPSDLAHATLLRSALEPWQPWFELAGLDWPEPSSAVRVDDLGLLMETVRHGYGVGLTRQHFAHDLLESGELVELFDQIHLKTPPHAYYMVYDSRVRERPEIGLFLDWMRSTFENI